VVLTAKTVPPSPADKAAPAAHNFILHRRSALLTTESELKLIDEPAIRVQVLRGCRAFAIEI
jgi:hypothetical protein